MFLRHKKKFSGEPKQRASRRHRMVTVTLIGTVLLMLSLSLSLLYSNHLTIGGIPSSIIQKFLTDSEAVDAYFAGDGKKVHDRLKALQIEKDIKDFYRRKISDEVELDRYIHQLLYDRTHYVGLDYQLNADQKLVLKDGIKSPSMDYR